jgi:hypothetical protein
MQDGTLWNSNMGSEVNTKTDEEFSFYNDDNTFIFPQMTLGLEWIRCLHIKLDA